MLRLRRIRLEGLIFVTFVTRFQGHIFFGELHYLPFKCMVSEEVFYYELFILTGENAKSNGILHSRITQRVHCNTLTYVKPLEIPENCGYVVQAFPGECSGRGRLPGKIVFVNPKNAWSKMSVKSDENSKSLRHNGYILSTNAKSAQLTH